VTELKRAFSIEAIVLGRNDDYEPNWVDKLIASIAHNRARFEGSHVDYSVCFVEWNPPRGRPILAPDLVKRFPYLRGIVVDADVHDALCTSPKLNMMLNFALNCGLRTSKADYCLVSAGDLFIGSTIAGYIRGVGLTRNCLYRAERVNISPNLDFAKITPADVEDAGNIISINTCTEPPYDRPPYTHACGDFLLADRLSMLGVRGFDEGIRSARLHLDSRFCMTAMDAGLNCNLIGQIFHINHTQSYTVLGDAYPDAKYQWDGGLPYLNPRNWGLADHQWVEAGERQWRVSRPATDKPAPPPQFTAAEIEAADAVTRRIIARKSYFRPNVPEADARILASSRLNGLTMLPHWRGARIVHGTPAVIETTPSPWGYSSVMELTPLRRHYHRDDGWFFWEIDAEVKAGEVGIGLGQTNSDLFFSERFLKAAPGLQKFTLPADQIDAELIVRNGKDSGRSRVVLHRVCLLHQPAPDQSTLEAEFLLHGT
jgi:hypothetical protein